MFYLFLFLAYGLMVGTIARWVVPGAERGGWILSIALGVSGAWLGGLVGRWLGMYGPAQGAGFVMSLLGAIVVVALYHGIAKRRHVLT